MRALCLYYAEALEHEAGLQASLPVGDLGGAVELTHTLDWHALARGQTVSIPGQAGIAQLLATASGNRLRLAGPIELRAGRGARDAALLPLFLLPVVATRRGGRVELRPESALRPNETWVKERFRGREAATFDDVLIRLGFYEERERGPMEDPEMVARPDLRLDEAWGAALDVFGDLWREPGDARRLGTAPPLARLNRAGFYNRLLLLSPVTSNYSGGTIKELRRIATRPDSELERTALAAFFAPFLSRVGPAPPPDPGTPQVVPEFQPLNAEQRAVLADTRTSPLTAVQGPPGTGKSLTVLHVLAAQALDGRPTLFASRNHRALEAVVPRLQAIDDDHPLILRLTRDAGETQDGGEDWVRAMLELTARPVSDERRAELRTARERLAQALGLRATVQRQLEAELVLAATLAEAHAEIASSDRIVDPALLSPVDARASLDPALAKRLERAATQLTRTDRSLLAPVRRFLANRSLVGLLGRSGRLPIDRPDRAAIATALARRVRARLTADRVEREALPRAERIDLVERLRSADEGVRETTRAALQALARALGTELDPQTAVSIANLRGEIGRRNVSRSLHRLGTGTLGLVHDLFRKSLEVVPLWACSSLSVRSRLPLVAGAFDLVVIDEASQCDIPSSIPLLFRARRSMVVGDPQQLQHVAHLDREGERRIRERHGVQDERFGTYLHSSNSVWNPSAAVARQAGGSTHLLREHWRCHPAIADYVSNLFYAGELRVRTPIEQSPPVVRGTRRLRGIEWTQVPGGSSSTPGGSRFWQPQIDAIVDELERVAKTGFDGTVGVVTPFRAHADRIRDAVAARMPADRLKAWRFESQTADGFQGDERDLILLGLVGGPDPSDVPNFYARDRNRFNVAVSRARGLLHVFGDRDWAASCGLETLTRLVDAWSAWQAKQQQPVRTDLIGPVWEPRLADALRTAGLDFHQQYPACGFYLDFAFLREGLKLAVEVDGETYHRDAKGNLRVEDARRDQMLGAAGWRVQRFWVYELRDDMEKCVERIRSLLAAS